LRVGGVPDPIHEEIACKEEDEKGCSEGVRMNVIEVVGEVEGAVAVAEGNASEIPEDEHEAPFLEVQVPKQKSLKVRYTLHGRMEYEPACNNTLFSF
jgi:hypothetical protein